MSGEASGAIACRRAVRRPGGRHAGASTSGYLHQVDVVRLLTFASVIAVHVVSNTTDEQGIAARRRAGAAALHPRDVLRDHRRSCCSTAATRARAARSTCRGSGGGGSCSSGCPYLVWTRRLLVGATAHRGRGRPRRDPADRQRRVPPLLPAGLHAGLPAVRAARGARARAPRGTTAPLLAAVAAYQVALFWWLHDVLPYWAAPRAGSPARRARRRTPAVLPGLRAGRRARRRPPRPGAGLGAPRTARLVAAGVVARPRCSRRALPAPAARRAAAVYRAADVLQPVMILWTAALTAGLLVLGLRYAARRRPGGCRRPSREGARISFGVFLVHPLVITAVLASPLAGPLRAGRAALDVDAAVAPRGPDQRAGGRAGGADAAVAAPDRAPPAPRTADAGRIASCLPGKRGTRAAAAAPRRHRRRGRTTGDGS